MQYTAGVACGVFRFSAICRGCSHAHGGCLVQMAGSDLAVVSSGITVREAHPGKKHKIGHLAL